MKKRRAPNIPEDEADEITVGEVLPQQSLAIVENR